jgi:hypothetical protein
MDHTSLFHQSSPTPLFQPLQKEYGKSLENKPAFQQESREAPTCLQIQAQTTLT